MILHRSALLFSQAVEATAMTIVVEETGATTVVATMVTVAEGTRRCSSRFPQDFA